MLPVPPGIQEYIQTQQSANLTYSPQSSQQKNSKKHDHNDKNNNSNNVTNSYNPNERCSPATFTPDDKYKNKQMTRSALLNEKRRQFFTGSPSKSSVHCLSKRFTSARDKASRIPRIATPREKLDDYNDNGNFAQPNTEREALRLDDDYDRDDHHSRVSSVEFDFSNLSPGVSINYGNLHEDDLDGINNIKDDSSRSRHCFSAMSYSSPPSQTSQNLQQRTSGERPKIQREKSSIPVAVRYRSKSSDGIGLSSSPMERHLGTRSHSNSRIPTRTQSPGGLEYRSKPTTRCRSTSPKRCHSKTRSRSNESIPLRTQSPGSSIPRSIAKGQRARERSRSHHLSRSWNDDIFVTRPTYSQRTSSVATVCRPRTASPPRMQYRYDRSSNDRPSSRHSTSGRPPSRPSSSCSSSRSSEPPCAECATEVVICGLSPK